MTSHELAKLAFVALCLGAPIYVAFFWGDPWIERAERAFVKNSSAPADDLAGDTCAFCGGHRTVEVYDISDEYAAPCPRCVGPDAYLAKITSKNGSYTAKDEAYARKALEAGNNA